MNRIALVTAAALFATSLEARAEDAAPASGAPPVVSTGGSAAPSSSGHSVVHGGFVVSGGTGSPVGDIFLNLLTLGIYAAAVNYHLEARREMLEDSWVHAVERKRDDGDGLQQRGYNPYSRVRRDAREGFLFSFGIGGGAVRYSDPQYLRGGALNFGLRMGYGFSDRFQLFGDFSADEAFYPQSRNVTNWLLTLRLRHIEVRRLRETRGVQVPLARDEHVVAVCVRQRGPRLDDDRPIHAVRDVRKDRLCPAMEHERAGIVRNERVVDRASGRNVLECDVRSDPRRVEVHRVRDRALVRQRQLDLLPLAHVDERCRGAAAERPRVVLQAAIGGPPN